MDELIELWIEHEQLKIRLQNTTSKLKASMRALDLSNLFDKYYPAQFVYTYQDVTFLVTIDEDNGEIAKIETIVAV